MAIANKTLEIHCGSTYTFEIEVTDWTGTAFDLTGYSGIFTARIVGEDASIEVTLSSFPDPSLGKMTIILPSDKTNVSPKQYDYGVKIQNTDTPPIVYTVADGKLIILVSKNT